MIPALGLLLGVAVGLAFKDMLIIPADLSRYLSIALLAALDSAFGGLRSSLQKNFSDKVFIIGLTSNALMAAFITYLGDRVGVELYLAAVIVFGVRIFHNLAAIRRHFFPAVTSAVPAPVPPPRTEE